MTKSRSRSLFDSNAHFGEEELECNEISRLGILREISSRVVGVIGCILKSYYFGKGKRSLENFVGISALDFLLGTFILGKRSWNAVVWGFC